MESGPNPRSNKVKLCDSGSCNWDRKISKITKRDRSRREGMMMVGEEAEEKGEAEGWYGDDVVTSLSSSGAARPCSSAERGKSLVSSISPPSPVSSPPVSGSGGESVDSS